MRKLIMISIASMLIVSCDNQDDIQPSDGSLTQINIFPMEELNDSELMSLQYMREEEKLARDVYIALYDKWNSKIFSNISASEQTHTEAVLTLLNKYNLVDPVGNNAAGVFTDSGLQNLYNQLVSQGSTSILDAYKVGATIEDLDIYDLERALLNIDNDDIMYVYDNLNRGSRNHMRAFYGKVIASGGTYTAQYIEQSKLEEIINSEKEKGSF